MLFGPTASGKSALALTLARLIEGAVVNADSMQVYRELPILGAQPSEEARSAVPHLLYGVCSIAEPCSAGSWLERVRDALATCRAQGRVPVFAGGTGLYLATLLDGIAPVPDIDAKVRDEARRLAREGRDELRRALAPFDPEAAARLGDLQRLARAYEVVRSTGRTLGEWQRLPRHRLDLPQPVLKLALLPPRDFLRERIARRFEAMIEAGALEEVRALAARSLDPDLPALRALGVPELAVHLRDNRPLPEALARAVTATRRYAKRQTTWLRGRMGDFRLVEAFGDELNETEARALLRRG